jgi:hypothetical protein
MRAPHRRGFYVLLTIKAVVPLAFLPLTEAMWNPPLLTIGRN